MLVRVTDMTPPTTPQRDHLRSHHGDSCNDPYQWLSDKTNTEVLDWLTAQNAYADSIAAHTEPLRTALFNEYVERTQETDMSVPVRRTNWWYFSRTAEGKQYGVSCRAAVADHPRRPVISPDEPLTGEEVLLDANVEAEGTEFFSIGALSVNNAGDHLGYSVDISGDERFDLRIRRIADGHIVDDVVKGIGYGVVWSSNDQYLWYTRLDDAWRPHQVWRHEIGTPADTDVLIFTEPNDMFFVGIGRSDDKQFLTIHVGSKTADEVHLIPLDAPTSNPRVVCPRQPGLEYHVTSAADRLFITHNRDNPNFDIATAPLETTSSADWQPWLTSNDSERILGVEAFATHLVVELRSQGLTDIRIARRDDTTGEFDQPTSVPVEEDLYTISPGGNLDYHATTFLYSYQSLIAPRQVIEHDIATGTSEVLKTQPVLGKVDLTAYRQFRTWATADDGTKIPVSVVHHKDTPLDGTAPAWLYGYGSYEHSIDPGFSITRLSTLDRGVVFAIAHIRGGGEMGRHWYEAGKMLCKKNTFTDFIRCADHLAEQNIADGDRIGASGRSAGGLLIGAVTNMAPSRFCAVHAGVPFVDTLTTILNPDMPLTVTEWEEWGNPLHDPEAYAYIKSYAPYENVTKQDYPSILATTSLNDTRVYYTEPAKWVAKLQEHATSSAHDRPVLLWTEMVAGHGGRSGRYDGWKELARDTAWMLDQLGVPVQ